MTAARGDFFAGLRIVYGMPFGDDMEVRRNVEQAIQDQGPCLCRKLFQSEDAQIIVVHAKVAAMRFQL